MVDWQRFGVSAINPSNPFRLPIESSGGIAARSRHGVEVAGQSQVVRGHHTASVAENSIRFLSIFHALMLALRVQTHRESVSQRSGVVIKKYIIEPLKLGPIERQL